MLLVSRIVVSQLLPGAAVIKGGFGIKLRLGESGSRATTDLDVAALRGADSRDQRDALIEELDSELAKGWGEAPPTKGQLRKDPAAPARVAFTGKVKKQKVRTPLTTSDLLGMIRVGLAAAGAGERLFARQVAVPVGPGEERGT